MPLMIGGGDSKPYVRYSPRDNFWEISTAEGRQEIDMESAPFVFDAPSIEMGWLKIDSDGRQWQMWPSLNERSPDPNPKGVDIKEWKIGWKIQLFSNKLFGEEPVREFSGNQAGVLQFVAAVFDAWERSEEGKAGQVPLIKLTGSKAMKMGKGSTRVPQFEIVKYVDRPEECISETVEVRPILDTPPKPVAEAPQASLPDEDEF